MVCRIMRIRSVSKNLPRIRANGKPLLGQNKFGLALLASGVDWAGISGGSVPETWPG